MLVDFHVLEALPYASHILDLTPVRRPDTPMGKPGDAAEAILIGSTPGSLGGRLRLSRNEKFLFSFPKGEMAIKEVNELLCHYVLHLCKLFAFGW